MILGHRRTGSAVAGLIGVLLATAAACTGTSDHPTRPTTAPATGSAPVSPRADVSVPLTGGAGTFEALPVAATLRQGGYVQHEYAASGTATSYRPQGELSGDGRWTFVPAGTAPYRTRIIVRRPRDAARFSGTVVVEWLNVSGGLDAEPEWASLHEELIRNGDVWVGVSAQRVGVMGGPTLTPVDVPGAEVAGKGLRRIDPARYGSLTHPGDGFAFDIFTQVADGIRAGGALDGLHPRRLIAAGESQSAIALVTYYDGVQPLTDAFDGFFVHSRGAVGLPLVGPGKYADLAGALVGGGRSPVIFRTDQSAPVMDLQSETDVTSILNSYAARQPDTRRFRLWEVAGTAHADLHLVGPTTAAALDCGVPINNGPMHIVAKAALHALETWMSTGEDPVQAPRIEVTPGLIPKIRRDADGIALGGIRTPPVDVPVATLSGAPGPNPSPICMLFGSTKPFPRAELAQRYPSRSSYLHRYDEDADQTISAGFALSADRPALLAYAEPERVRTRAQARAARP